ncbi:class I SAM-dependent methyltransferase [Streptomyces sp. NRRL F-5630]|uniref:class I SAM-dependent methyltransferase n=1 Tax=Streptomyces sp. NRRL F-5630 TaxID=1463864 RepID=UPI0004CC4607|nr:class I SAM-dependent methyltransferase [Streptomyces sp. NRRL F-5630]
MDISGTAREVTACRMCGEEDWQKVVDFGPVPLADSFLEPAASYDDEPRYPLAVISCRSCRLMSLTHVVDPEALYRTYPYTTSDSETIKKHMGHVVAVCVERFGIPEGSFVLEIGSNTGSQLKAFQNAGMRTLGIDPARNIAVVANERGVETLPEFFSVDTAALVKKTYGTPQLILGRHVFAHIDDVASVAEGVRNLLGPDSLFAIEVPYLVDMLERNEFDTIYHEHLSYFGVGTLVTLFQRHGLRVVDVERLAVHGGSILVFVGLDDGTRPTSPAVGELIALEKRTGLHEDATYQRFAEHVEQITGELTALVRSLRAEGKRIAGYGAPAKGNTLLNVCGLTTDDLEFCCDTTEFKQGLVLPGTHIPVHSPAYAKAQDIDYFLLLAWNYGEEIMAKEAAFLARGGRFILPNPRPSIVPSGA